MRFQEVDAELLARCRDGNLHAFDALFDLVAPELYRLVYAILHNHEDTEEVVQDCLLRCYRKLPHLRSPQSFGFWLTRIAVNCARTRLRTRSSKWKRDQRALFELDPGIEELPVARSGPPENAMAHELGQRIQQAIAALPPRQRTAFVLFELHGLTVREVARTMRCTTGAVKFHLCSARRRLQLLLEPYVRTSPEVGRDEMR